MSSPPEHRDAEQLEIHRCLEGDPVALTRLREAHHPSLVHILRARGASTDETEELLADLWGDCVPPSGDQPSLLDKFSGKCSLQGWLATVATRRWIDLKRKQQRRGQTPAAHADESHSDPLDMLPGSSEPDRDDILVELLRDSLQAAFAVCSPEDLLMLRLVYIHDLSQRELMRMWGWSESKVSRHLSHAMQQIELNTIRELKQKDPWLQLTWRDFVDLCETQQIGFL